MAPPAPKTSTLMVTRHLKAAACPSKARTQGNAQREGEEPPLEKGLFAWNHPICNKNTKGRKNTQEEGEKNCTLIDDKTERKERTGGLGLAPAGHVTEQGFLVLLQMVWGGGG
ncbi:hypothetical protein KIL84_016650 [Mauremys mutica]|uniref:Uncharacterized protein n=1 Tax=Mauremys mutica TaxID=74926 RepID=A0A9D3X4P8_9SAUR|nr:hypothetical protein KIL84_016650 [Mauremys mutica]